MAGKGDERLSTEPAHLIGSTTDPSESTSSETFQGSLVEGREQCQAAQAALDQAAKAVDDDKIENATAALTFDKCLTATVGELVYIWDDGKNRVLNLRPAERDALGAVELRRRKEFFKTNLDTPPSRLSSKGRTAAVTKLKSIHQRLSDAPEYFPPEVLAPLGEKLDALPQAHEGVLAEARDDHPLMVTLEAARDRATSRRVAMRGLLASVLGFEESPLSVDEFILQSRAKRKKEE